MKTFELGTRRSSLVAVTFAVVALGSSRASAQEWLKDRQYQEGAGVRTGDLELHPGLGGEVGYDSNYLLRSHKTGFSNSAPTSPVEGAAVLRITPSLSLSTLGAQRKEGDVDVAPPTIKFRMGLAGTYRHFFGAKVIEDQRNVSANVSARLDVLPEKPIGFGVFGGYERTIRPSTAGNPDLSFNRNDLSAGAELVMQPGGGTLDWRLGYQFRASLFEDTLGVPYTNTNHEIFTKGRWRFRPRTALLYDASFRWLNYSEKQRATTVLNNGSPTRARLGLTGLVTPRLSFLGMAGYGTTFFDDGKAVTVRQFDSVIGQAELRYFLSAAPDSPDQPVSLTVSSVAVGYNRDFQTSFLGNYYGLDRGYLKFVYMFGGRFLLSAEGGVGAIQYPEVFATGTNAQVADKFTDIRADATLFGEYRFTSSFGLNTTLTYVENFSNKQLPLGTASPGTAGLFDLSWRRFEAFLGARWFL